MLVAFFVLTIFCVLFVVAAASMRWCDALFFAGLAFGVFALFRSLFVGLMDVITVAKRHMDVIVEENGAGIMLGKERWYLFLDSITRINKYRVDIWTIQFWNGSVLHIPVAAITDEQMSYIKSEMERGKTAEGRQAIIERGRIIRELERKGEA